MQIYTNYFKLNRKQTAKKQVKQKNKLRQHKLF